MIENKDNSFIPFCYINKNPEMKLINCYDVETRIIEDDDTDEQYQVAF